MLLRICVPSSGVITADEGKQLEKLRENNVTPLMLLAMKEQTNTRLTSFKEELDNLTIESANDNISVADESHIDEEMEDVED